MIELPRTARFSPIVSVVPKLRDVFGIGADVQSPSYVDRGRLDQRFKDALNADRHIVVHGESKQGKSWLRMKGLPENQSVVIQCVLNSTPESVLREALGRLGVNAVLNTTKARDLQGTPDFTAAAAELGKILAKVRAEGRASGTVSQSTEVEYEPIGKTAADLSWVSETLVASGKRLVLEDFHYISEDAQKEFAFMLKAMGEYGLYVVIAGVWTRDHLLTYYNGDLEGRVEDIHLQWSAPELRQVLVQGSDALHIDIREPFLTELVDEASGSAGLVQRLAERLCQAEGIVERSYSFVRPPIGSCDTMTTAKREVAEQMEGRFQTFADNFVRGMRRLAEGLEVYKFLLRAASNATDDDLTNGLDSKVLLDRIVELGGDAIRASDLTQALERIDRLQVKIDVRPPVLTYTKSARKLFLADRAFLFFRRNGNPAWPWMSDSQDITNDLAIQEPLDFD